MVIIHEEIFLNSVERMREKLNVPNRQNLKMSKRASHTFGVLTFPASSFVVTTGVEH